MEFWVADNTVLNRATDPDKLRDRVPGFSDSMDGVADLRRQQQENGLQGWSLDKEWRHVASIHGPVLAVAELLDAEFLNRNGKRDFYRWLDTHTGYTTYDRRRQGAKRGDMAVFQDGVPIV